VKAISVITFLLEELFPFLFYWARRHSQFKRIESLDLDPIAGPYESYYGMTREVLEDRIAEERERARSMDEKTFKMTLSLSIGLTILGSTVSMLVGKSPIPFFRTIIAATASLSIFYTLAGGFLALGALKTLPSYGYGTDFLIRAQREKKIVVQALGCQEKMNLIRHLRNESAYQCLRNGFILLLISVSLFTFSFTISEWTSSRSNESDQIHYGLGTISCFLKRPLDQKNSEGSLTASQRMNPTSNHGEGLSFSPASPWPWLLAGYPHCCALKEMKAL
jgi:hypothetical protein